MVLVPNTQNPREVSAPIPWLLTTNPATPSARYHSPTTPTTMRAVFVFRRGSRRSLMFHRLYTPRLIVVAAWCDRRSSGHSTCCLFGEIDVDDAVDATLWIELVSPRRE